MSSSDSFKNYLVETATFTRFNAAVSSSAVATPLASATVIERTGTTLPLANLANSASYAALSNEENLSNALPAASPITSVGMPTPPLAALKNVV